MFHLFISHHVAVVLQIDAAVTVAPEINTAITVELECDTAITVMLEVVLFRGVKGGKLIVYQSIILFFMSDF